MMRPMSNKIELLPIGAMARRLGVPPKELRREAEAGTIPCTRVGAAMLFNPKAVERVLLERAAKGQDAQGVHHVV